MDEHAITDLVLYIQNDRMLYQRSTVPVISSLNRKKKNGTYDNEKALIAFAHVAEAGAKAYYKEFGRTEKWYQMFPVVVRKAAAAALLEDYWEEINCESDY